MRRWRIVLSAVLPVVALIWVGVAAAAGSRTPYSAGPVSAAHAYTEQRCDACHTTQLFRAHTTDEACLACHDAPAHVTAARLGAVGRGFGRGGGLSRGETPPCSACHQEHRGRVQL